MTLAQPDTDELMRRSAAGDRAARGPLLQRHRQRLRRMVAARLDPRLATRVDPSDVVQEVLAEADRRLDDYLRRRPIAFYPWLRQMVWEKLVEEHRRHVRAARRTVTREAEIGLPDGSVHQLAERLLDPGTGPSAALQRREVAERVRAALQALPDADREVLVLRYVERLSAQEVGEVLGLSEAAAKKRALRALRRLRDALGGGNGGGSC
jgi:RNA polymerase sigma-70 factor (ECF subfamily)